MKSVWVVSELYYPEDTSTGYFLTRIAEELAREFAVNVVCSQPTYSARGKRAAPQETRRDVVIRRCWSTTFDKNVLVFRLVNIATLSLSILGRLLFRLRRGAVVLAVTNPPTLPVVASLACWWRGAHLVLLVHDVYPDAFVAAGLMGRQSLLARCVAQVVRLVYTRSARIIVIGRDMKVLVEERACVAGRIVTITNWADIDEVTPMARSENQTLKRLGLASQFVVQYAGNMGRTHDLESVLAAVERLRDEPRVHFLLAGEGAKRPHVERWIAAHADASVTLLDRQDRSCLSELLNACDLTLISLLPGMTGVSVPSRMYNILAAGKPILAMTDPSSELAMMIEEEAVGWTVRPGDIEGMVAAVREAAADRGRLGEMGRRARAVAESKYSLTLIGKHYREVVESIDVSDE